MTRSQYVLEVTADFPTCDNRNRARGEDLLLKRLRALHHMSTVVVANATAAVGALSGRPSSRFL
jgi:hypothetical protein